ncbi:MAG TPA: DUF47 family protein, partial [Bryobacteraceae bacterium]|nr:DUF47 family protein [Bryobacteraceae bacterium]
MRFLPREEKFFELFLDQTRLINDAAKLLSEGADAGNSRLAAAAQTISELERRADKVLHEIFQRLNQTFITPLDPEDIHSLGTHLDDVIDGIEDMVHRLATYRIEPVPEVVKVGCRHLVDCCAALHQAFMALHENRKLIEHCIEVTRIEDLVDELMRGAVRDLFENETDPIRIIKLKELYDLLE